jgi:hypothetical protein
LIFFKKKLGGLKIRCNFAALFETRKAVLRKVEKIQKKFAGIKISSIFAALFSKGTTS